MVRLLALVLLFILSAGPACTPLASGGAAQSMATGIDGVASRQVIIADRGHDLMIGQVLVLRQNNRTALTAEVGQLHRSGQVRLRMDSAWHEGRALPFRRAVRSERFCTRPGQCRGYRTGTFVLSKDAFEAALTEGFTATLVGPDAVVEVHFPPTIFIEARDRAVARGLWPV
jgi:hypothetical protein